MIANWCCQENGNGFLKIINKNNNKNNNRNLGSSIFARFAQSGAQCMKEKKICILS